MGEKTDVTTPADHRIIIRQHCGAAAKVKCPPLERAPGSGRGYYPGKGLESQLANKSLGASKSRL